MYSGSGDVGTFTTNYNPNLKYSNARNTPDFHIKKLIKRTVVQWLGKPVRWIFASLYARFIL